MASQTEHERDEHFYSQGDIESPFLHEEPFGREMENAASAPGSAGGSEPLLAGIRVGH
jgi:hypothetical protein